MERSNTFDSAHDVLWNSLATCAGTNDINLANVAWQMLSSCFVSFYENIIAMLYYIYIIYM